MALTLFKFAKNARPLMRTLNYKFLSKEDITMVEVAQKLSEQVDELIELAGTTLDVKSLKTMDETSFKALQLSLKMADTAKELLMEEAKAMDRIEQIKEELKKLNEINKKLDELEEIDKKLDKLLYIKG